MTRLTSETRLINKPNNSIDIRLDSFNACNQFDRTSMDKTVNV